MRLRAACRQFLSGRQRPLHRRGPPQAAHHHAPLLEHHAGLASRVASHVEARAGGGDLHIAGVHDEGTLDVVRHVEEGLTALQGELARPRC